MERKNPSVRNVSAPSTGVSKSTKKVFILLCVMFLFTASLFAADNEVSGTIITKMNLLMDILYSPWIKALFGIVVGFKAVSFIVNHEQGTFKKLIPLAGAALIYFLAPTVADKLVGNETYQFSTSDGKVQKTSN